MFSFYYRYMLDKAWLDAAALGRAQYAWVAVAEISRQGARCIGPSFSGETATGASLHYMVEKPDAGALVDQEAVPILENDTALDVSIKVAEAAQKVLAPQPAALDRGHRTRRSPGLTRVPTLAGAARRTGASIGAAGARASA